jgi:hypothetical protein
VNFTAPSSDLPDFWAIHTDVFGNDTTVWASLQIAKQWSKHMSLTISPAQRHHINTIRKQQNTKVGIIVGVKDSHRLHAIRTRSILFGGNIDIEIMRARGLVLDLDRSAIGELSRAIEFFARDDGEVDGRWW